MVGDDSVWVSFERDSASAVQDLVITRGDLDGPFVPEFVFPTQRSEPLNPILHAHDELVWVDWKLDDQAMASAQLVDDEDWVLTHVVPWPDDSWVGVESTRRAIRRLVVIGF